MGKPVAKRREARRNALLKTEDGADVDFSPRPTQVNMTKKERIFAKREAKVATAAKKRARGHEDGAPKVVNDEATTASAGTKPAKARSAFAPAQAARQAASAIRAAKKSSHIKLASARRNTTMTTTNLSDRERHRIFQSEIQQIQQVASHSAFQADPFGAIEAHLAATADRLQPQTPDIGRRHDVKPDPRRGLAARQMQTAQQQRTTGRR